MTERITLENLETRCESVNRRIAHTCRYVQVQGRNGYFCLDEYAEEVEVGGTSYRKQMVRTLTCGTKRKVGEFLHAMMVGIDLARTPR